MKQVMLVVALVALCGLASVVVVADPDDHRTQVDVWSGLVTVAVPVITPIDSCDGTDGTYTLLHVTGTGPMVSANTRIAGNFIVDALILDSPTTGYGVSVDNWSIVDPVSGATKASGKAIATDLGPNPRAISYGFLDDGSLLVANTLVTLPAPGSGNPLTIAYGTGPTTIPDRGVILDGNNSCVRKLLRALGK